jgi:hypothetical protein
MDGFETMGHILKSKVDSPYHPLGLPGSGTTAHHGADAYVVKSRLHQAQEAISELLGPQEHAFAALAAQA